MALIGEAEMTTKMKVTMMETDDDGYLGVEEMIIIWVPDEIYDRIQNCHIITANMNDNTYHAISDWISETYELDNVNYIEILTNA